MLRSIRSFDRREFSRRAASGKGKEGSKTVQSDRKGSDINEIVKRFGLTGQLPVPRAVPQFRDFLEAPDFRGAMEIIVQAREAFEDLPARIRERFGSPEAYVDYVSNPENKEELIKLGLAKADPVPEPEKIQKVEVVNAPSDGKGGK